MDDTNLLHISMDNMEALKETHDALQCSVTSWGAKLIATGGALKQSKCFITFWISIGYQMGLGATTHWTMRSRNAIGYWPLS